MTVGSFLAGLADTIRAAGGIAVTIGNDVIAPLRREEFIPLRAKIATATLQGEYDRMIFQTTCCARENVRMRSTEAR